MEKITINHNTKIGVLCGGLSDEREVSLRSGNNCFAALQRLGYKNAELIDVGHDIAQVLTTKKIEIAFLALHGKYGEDGTVQGLLELLRIPYTGSGVLASALGMNKKLTKQVLKANNLPAAPTVIITEKAKLDNAMNEITWLPIMVKPVVGGSSVGVLKIDNKTEVKSAISDTFAKYGGAVIEKYIQGQEITIGVLEKSDSLKNGTASQALPILELRPKSKAGFYDYEAKYTKGMTEFVLPAELPDAVTDKAQKLAVETFVAMGCSGYARVDMMVDKEGNLYILEVNTLPGMTDTSDLPAMAEKAGISYDQLVERILFSSGLDK